MSRATVLLSGGMDSTTLAYFLKNQGFQIRALSIGYGQRHEREILAAKDVAEHLGVVDHHILDLRGLAKVLPGSALTDPSVRVPHGHYEAENMKLTVVPNRNAVFLSLAFSVASAYGDDLVATAVHAGDHAIYADCRIEFIKAFRAMERTSLEEMWLPLLSTPFIAMSKTDIARTGARLKVPYKLTWTCYEGGLKHCGQCGACVERQEAFKDSETRDPTRYVKPWKF